MSVHALRSFWEKIISFSSCIKEAPGKPFRASKFSYLKNREPQRAASSIPVVTKMKNNCEGQVIGIPAVAIKERSFGFSWINKLRKRSNNLNKSRHGDVHENLSETAKCKLNLSKRTHQTTRVERIFRKSFSLEKDERLIKGCKCYLSTTNGPIKGTLFISTKKVAFCSDESLKIPSLKGEFVEVPYKVLIPVKKVKKTLPRENAEQPDEKYLQIVTVDNFEFWFMGCYNHQDSSDVRKMGFQ